MENTKKLLSITNLKKYFPVAKTSIFQRKQLYVRANEDITLDIYEGETLGIVGESGCGKSTLGRVLLQLYPQTAGCTLYYGTRLDRLTPEYVIDTIRNDEKYRSKLKKSIAKAEELAKKVEEAGGEDSADFYLLQDANIARCEMETDLSNLVKIIGGFYVHDDKEGMKLLADIYEEHKKQNAIYEEQTTVQLESDSYADILSEGQGSKAEKAKSKKAAADAKVAELQKRIDEYDQKIIGLEEKLAAVRAKYANDEEFQHYEALRDDGIDLARLKYGEMRKLRKDGTVKNQLFYSLEIIREAIANHKMVRFLYKGYRIGSGGVQASFSEHVVIPIDTEICGGKYLLYCENASGKGETYQIDYITEMRPIKTSGVRKYWNRVNHLGTERIVVFRAHEEMIPSFVDSFGENSLKFGRMEDEWIQVVVRTSDDRALEYALRNAMDTTILEPKALRDRAADALRRGLDGYNDSSLGRVG